MNNITVGKNVPNQMATAIRDLDELKSLFSQGSTAINFFNMTSPVQGLDSKGVEQLGTQLSEADIANYNEVSNTSNLQGKGGGTKSPQTIGAQSSSTSTPKVNDKKFTKTGGDDGLHFTSREDAEKYLMEGGQNEIYARTSVDRLIDEGKLKIQPPLSEAYKARQAELDAQHAGEQEYDKYYRDAYKYEKWRMEDEYAIRAQRNPEAEYQEIKRWQDPNYVNERLDYYQELKSRPTNNPTYLHALHDAQKTIEMNHYLNEPEARKREALALFTQGAATPPVPPSTPSGSGITFSSRTRENPTGTRTDVMN